MTCLTLVSLRSAAAHRPNQARTNKTNRNNERLQRLDRRIPVIGLAFAARRLQIHPNDVGRGLSLTQLRVRGFYGL